MSSNSIQHAQYYKYIQNGKHNKRMFSNLEKPYYQTNTNHDLQEKKIKTFFLSPK
jgi:hypothetical protein